MNKKAYYEVWVPTSTSKNGHVKRTKNKMVVEVVVMESDKGRCLITPVTGYGTVSVLNDSVKLM